MRLSPLEALALRAGITGEDFDRLDAVMADVGRGMRNEWKPQYADCEFPNCECPWPFEDHCRHKPMEEPT